MLSSVIETCHRNQLIKLYGPKAARVYSSQGNQLYRPDCLATQLFQLTTSGLYFFLLRLEFAILYCLSSMV